MKNKVEIDYEALQRALDGIKFGSVEIIIHDSRVVQIERHEKIRFDKRNDERSK